MIISSEGKAEKYDQFASEIMNIRKESVSLWKMYFWELYPIKSSIGGKASNEETL